MNYIAKIQDIFSKYQTKFYLGIHNCFILISVIMAEFYIFKATTRHKHVRIDRFYSTELKIISQ